MPSGSPDCSRQEMLSVASSRSREGCDFVSTGDALNKDMMNSTVKSSESEGTPTNLSVQCSFESLGSVGSLDSGHSSELGHAHSPSSPRSQTPNSTSAATDCSSYLNHHHPPEVTAIRQISGDGLSSDAAAGPCGTPPNPQIVDTNNTPPNFFDGGFLHEDPVSGAIDCCSTPPVPHEGSSEEDDLDCGGRRHHHSLSEIVRRSTSRDSGHPPTVMRSDSMGSNVSRNSETSTISAMSGLSALSALSSYSGTSNYTNSSNYSGLSRNSGVSSLSTLSRKSGVSSMSSVSQTSETSGVSRLSDISGLSTSTASSTRTLQPRKTREELQASIDQLESLWSSEDDWIMIFDRLINNSLTSRPRRRHTHATSTHYAPYRSPQRVAAAASKSVSLTSSPYHTRYSYQDTGKCGDDETDRSSIKSGGGVGKSRASSAPPVRRTVMGTPLPPRAGPQAAAGSVDESYFFGAFEDCPKVNLYSVREMDEVLNKIREVIISPATEWDKRVEMLRKVRSVVVAGGPNYEEFFPHLRLLEPAFCQSIKDLRSQVVREACITVAYLSQELHHRVDHLCEMVLPPLLCLIPNGAKVMSTSGTVCIRFIIQNTHHHKILPILVRELTTSKSREIRKAVCEFLDQLVHTWPAHAMDKHSALLAEGIKKGICDADSEARAFSRKAYWGYADHFKEEADKLLNSLELSYRKMLQGEMGVNGNSGSSSMTYSGSSHSLQQQQQPQHINPPVKPALPPRTNWSRSSTSDHHPSSVNHHMLTSSTSHPMTASTSSTGSIASAPPSRTGSLRRTAIPTTLHRPSPPSASRHQYLHQQDSPDGGSFRGSPGGSSTSSGGGGGGGVGFRSNSAIDVHAARRAQARAQYANANRLKIGSGVSLPRPRKSMDHPPPLSNSSVTSPDRNTRSRTRGCVSQSQPGSRSGSPSSRLSYATYSSPHGAPSSAGSGGTLGRTRRRSGIPRSTGTSREPSPTRYAGAYGHSSSGMATPKSRTRSISGVSACGDMPPLGPNKPRPSLMMADKILQQSREAEHALADALVPAPPVHVRSPNRKMSGKAFDDQSENDSETSSICSERSFDSYRRNEIQDVADIISNCASTHWGDRKEGLLALYSFLRGSSMLTGSELKRVTEIFTKMFMDAHTKVFTLFLDTLMQLIYVHRADLCDWLYVLLTRLLHKLGSDLLGSVQSKIHETLDIVRSSFPYDAQFQVMMRFLVDPTQTPNNKVKLSTLTYLKCLVDSMERGDLASSQDTPVAIAKILTWTADQKSVDIRRASSACFVAMFNCNMTEFSALLQQLPPACQNTASQIIQNHLKRAASLDKSPSSLPPRTPPSSGGTPILQSPNTSLPRSHRPSRHSTLDLDDTENLNPEEVYKSLKRTTDEIRNYSFELELNNGAGRDNLEKHRDSTSQDSGISQLSAGGGDLRSLEVGDGGGLLLSTSNHIGGDIAAGGLDDGVGSGGLLSGRSSSVSSPTHRSAGALLPGADAHHPRNGLLSLNDDEVDHLTMGEGESDSAAMANVIQILRVGGGGTPPDVRAEERKAALTTLVRLARTGSTIVWNDNFRAVLRLLVENLESSVGCERALVLTVLTEMMRRCPLVNLFLNYSELIILRVLKAHADKEKEVIRAAQVCAGTVAEILPPEVVIRVLKPLIQMGDYPVNQSAIKMLNKLIEAHPPAIVAQALPDIMPGLVKAYDNKDSSVRKASVFCMVSLHNCVGEDTLRPHLETLTGSKLKLLNLYIKRADTQNSGASSPKSEPHI